MITVAVICLVVGALVALILLMLRLGESPHEIERVRSEAVTAQRQLLHDAMVAEQQIRQAVKRARAGR